MWNSNCWYKNYVWSQHFQVFSHQEVLYFYGGQSFFEYPFFLLWLIKKDELSFSQLFMPKHDFTGATEHHVP